MLSSSIDTLLLIGTLVRRTQQDPFWIPYLSGTEGCLNQLYYGLFNRCTFDEFCHAFKTSGILALMGAHGLQSKRKEFPYLAKVLGPGGAWSSVWFLRQYLASNNDYTEHAVWVEYGFLKCKDTGQRMDLKNAYERYFESEQGDPWKLDKACCEDKHYEHVANVIDLKPSLRRLMQNVYLLPHYDQ